LQRENANPNPNNVLTSYLEVDQADGALTYDLFDRKFKLQAGSTRAQLTWKDMTRNDVYIRWYNSTLARDILKAEFDREESKWYPGSPTTWLEYQSLINGTAIGQKMMKLMISEYEECVEVDKKTIQSDMLDQLYAANVDLHVGRYDKQLKNLTETLEETIEVLEANKTYWEDKHAAYLAALLANLTNSTNASANATEMVASVIDAAFNATPVNCSALNVSSTNYTEHCVVNDTSVAIHPCMKPIYTYFNVTNDNWQHFFLRARDGRSIGIQSVYEFHASDEVNVPRYYASGYPEPESGDLIRQVALSVEGTPTRS
jgi:hypothetical protein